MALLQEEKTSLSDYGRLIGEASQAIFSGDQGSAQALGNSIERLRQATERQATRNAAMEARVANQSETMDTIQRDLAAFEATKFTDAATGLGNRRAFNKAVAKVYANPELPLPCALAVVEVDVGKGRPACGGAALPFTTPGGVRRPPPVLVATWRRAG